MITFDLKLGRGIHEGSKFAFNVELIDFAKKNDLDLPFGYHPAILERDYLLNDFAKFRKSYQWSPDPEAWNMAKQALEFNYSLHMISKPLTFEEAISQMELSASPGFPWNEVYKTKRAVLENEIDLVRKLVDQVFTTGNVDYEFNGKRYDNVYWQTSSKSEIRPIEKVNDPDFSKRKTRTFMCGDLITHIVGFMLYKNQNDGLLELADTNHWTSVGFNPFYGGVNKMCNRLLRNATDWQTHLFKCYDASHMEASVNDAIQSSIYEVRNRGLSDKHKIAADWFFLQISNSLIIDVDGYLCMKNGKNPSGNYNTLTDNTLALNLVFNYSVAVEEKDFNKVVNAVDRIACEMLGDDSIFEDCKELENLEQNSARLGFDLKPEAAPGPLSACSYLSANFVLNKQYGMWVQKQNFDKIMANAYFNFKARSWRLCWVKLCSARKLFFAFPDYKRQIDQLLRHIKLHHYEDMRNELCDVLTFEQAISQYMPDSQNQFLVFGFEGASEPTAKHYEQTFVDECYEC